MKNLAFINGKDIWTTWGARLERGAYEALLTPGGLKPPIENSSASMDGTDLLYPEEPKLKEREVSFVVTLRATEKNSYLENYRSFVNELRKGKIELEVAALSMKFILYYESCTKFGNYGNKYGKFSLRFREPVPGRFPDKI